MINKLFDLLDSFSMIKCCLDTEMKTVKSSIRGDYEDKKGCHK
jgi:hypothetical protein